jgi:protoporphyrinogen oxidase
MGGHVIFSHYAYFSRLLDYLLSGPDDWNSKIREAWVWMRGTFIPYPLQQNLHRLPKSEIVACIDGLLDNERRRPTFTKPTSFAEWMEQSFGRGLCDTFMRPYNFKVWAYSADKMNVEWMGERVATVNVSRVIHNVILSQDELGWGPNNTFRFPMNGGTGAIWRRLAEVLPQEKFQFSKKVTKIDVIQKLISYEDGSSESYDAIVSTMPMNCLCQILEGTTKISRTELLEKSKQFRYSSSHIIGFGFEGQPPAHLVTKCWMYFPEDDCPFYRATVFSNYSPNHVPKPGEQWSLMCEVAESSEKPVDIKNIIAIAEQGLKNTKLIDNDTKILSRFHTRLEYGYPTPFFGRDQLCAPLFEEFESHNIYSRGRFGTWKYEVSNQDHSMMLGVVAIDKIIFGTEELTQKYPDIVNAKRDNVGRVPYIPTESKQIK